MLKKLLKILWKSILLLCAAGLLGVFLPRLITTLYAWNRTYQVDQAPVERVAIVFGAGLRRDGTPTAILRDRVETAVKLYLDGKVEKLLMSGDNSVENHNEPEAMRQYAVSLGVPDQAIVLDYAGSGSF